MAAERFENKVRRLQPLNATTLICNSREDEGVFQGRQHERIMRLPPLVRSRPRGCLPYVFSSGPPEHGKATRSPQSERCPLKAVCLRQTPIAPRSASVNSGQALSRQKETSDRTSTLPPHTTINKHLTHIVSLLVQEEGTEGGPSRDAEEPFRLCR